MAVKRQRQALPAGTTNPNPTRNILSEGRPRFAHGTPGGTPSLDGTTVAWLGRDLLDYVNALLITSFLTQMAQLIPQGNSTLTAFRRKTNKVV